MKRTKAIEFIEALVKLRTSASDTQAIEADAVYPEWKDSTNYLVGDRISYGGTLYKVITAHTSQADWTPDVAVSLFAKVLIPNENAIPEWEQPDSTNPYMTGDKVVYDGKTYESLIDNNIWSPIDYPAGWQEI
jgi:chitodextrinase